MSYILVGVRCIIRHIVSIRLVSAVICVVCLLDIMSILNKDKRSHLHVDDACFCAHIPKVQGPIQLPKTIIASLLDNNVHL